MQGQQPEPQGQPPQSPPTQNQAPEQRAPQPQLTPKQARRRDRFERAAWSAGQALFAVLLADSAINDVRQLPWLPALGTAVFTFVVSLVGPVFRNFSKKSFRNDLVVRLARTFIVTLLGALGVYSVADALNWDWATAGVAIWPALNVATLALLGALAKGMLARQETPGGENPSTLPAETYSRALAPKQPK